MDAIIFDVDGTLWDSRVPVAHAWNHSIERLTGKPSSFTPEYLGQFFGKTMDVIVQVLLPDCPPEERLRLGEQIFREENDWLEQEPGTLYPGVEETLAELGRRWPLFIVSNCQNGYIQVMLKTTGLGRFFSGYLSYGDTGKGKEKNLVTLCRRYGLSAPVYVGDTQGDADACAEARIPMIYAAYGLGTVARPWQTIRAFHELLGLLPRLEGGAV